MYKYMVENMWKSWLIFSYRYNINSVFSFLLKWGKGSKSYRGEDGVNLWLILVLVQVPIFSIRNGCSYGKSLKWLIWILYIRYSYVNPYFVEVEILLYVWSSFSLFQFGLVWNKKYTNTIISFYNIGDIVYSAIYFYNKSNLHSSEP